MRNSTSPMARIGLFWAFFLTLAITLAPTSAEAAPVSGRVSDPSGLPLPGVSLTFTRDNAQPVVLVTDNEGKYSIDLPPGRYILTAELSGFESIKAEVNVPADGSAMVRDLAMKLAAVQTKVDVVAPAPSILGTGGPSQPAAINRTVIDNATVPNNKFEDVLPLLPSVVRGPDGLISVAGARAPQGSLLVNGVRETDPVTGQFAASLPLAAVESVEVFATSAAAEHGNAVGGITDVRTRAGDDKWRFSINSLTPRPRFDAGGIQGIDAWEPNGGIRGPIVRGRAWLAQSFDYRFERAWFDTLAGRQPTRMKGLFSLTQVDTEVRPGHLVTGLVAFYPQKTEHAALGAFTPSETTPNLHTGGWSTTFIDRLTVRANAALESRLQLKRLDSETTVPEDASGSYVVGHDIVRGAYFYTQSRTSWQVAWDEAYSHVRTTPTGEHELKVGFSLSYATFDGDSSGRPVAYARSDGTLSRLVEFQGPGAVSASARHVGLFAQDSWRPSGAWRFDFGARFDASTLATGPRLAPRAGFAYATPDRRTTFTGNLGIYADKLLLSAGAFPLQQERVLSIFDRSGTLTERLAYRNVISGRLHAPQAVAWNLQVDRHIGSGWMARAKYQQRRGYDEIVVSPLRVSPAEGLMVLTANGESRARSIEATVGRRSATNEFYMSYVRASSRGNLNDLSSVEGDLRLPLVQPDQIGPLSIEVPHRLLVWGIVRLPRKITVAPFVEVRSGFPYSIVDEDWNEIGRRNSARFPTFASLDLVVTKIVSGLPFGLPPARLGMKLYNVTGRFNARDVQRDIERPDFGTTYNPIRRQLRGVFEFGWGGQ